MLVVNHALFFTDLALRMAGVNYLPKYDLVILDEAHTVEDVAGQHFGLKVSEAGIRYQLRTLYDPTTRQGHAQHPRLARQRRHHRRRRARRAPRRASSTAASAGRKPHGRSNGRMHENDIVENDLTPKLQGPRQAHQGDARRHRERRGDQRTDQPRRQGHTPWPTRSTPSSTNKLEDAVYWMDVSGPHRPAKRVSLHAAPV